MKLHSWIARMKEKKKKKQEIKMKQKLSFLIGIITENEKNINKKIQALYEFVEKSNYEIINELLAIKELIKVLDKNMMKQQSDIDKSKIILQENMEEFKNCLIENNVNIKESIYSVITKVEQIDKYGLEREKKLEDIILEKSEKTEYGIDNIKSLIQLLAVNELLDEIDIYTTKN